MNIGVQFALTDISLEFGEHAKIVRKMLLAVA